MKISVLTLGCRINQAESLNIEQTLQSSGHQLVDMSGNPDICIINTCAVTSKASAQSRQLVNKAIKNNIKVIVTGCYVELNKENLNNLDNVEIVDNASKAQIINMIPAKASSFKEVIRVTRSRPIIKVQEGCNFSCSYCVIPMVRGKSKSLPVDEIINQIKDHESLEHYEVVLSGIHLGTYGFDLNPKKSLSTLLKNILKNTSIPRIRLSSLEIKEIDDQLLELLTDDRVCNHLHIPLQSGDDRILKLMNRTYSSKEFLAGIERITSTKPGIALGTDVIVGFPGEGETEFQNSKNFIESMPFTYLHVFPYSPRPHTKAIGYPNHVSEPVKKERVALLRDIGSRKKKDYIRSYIGKTIDVILESDNKERMNGTSRNYIKVLVQDKGDMKEGMLVDTRISSYKNEMAIGTPVKILKPIKK